MENINKIISYYADAIQNDKIRAFMLKGIAQFAEAWTDAEDDILLKLSDAAEEGQDGEKIPVVGIAFNIKLDLGANKQSGAIAVNIRRVHEVESSLPDPNQPEFKL